MASLAVASLLGMVEGLTEFLPISSSGHLVIAGHLLGFFGTKAATFEVVIQAGAILAVVFLYRKRFLSFFRPQSSSGFSGIRGFALLLLTTFPAALLGLFLRNSIKSLFSPLSVAAALIAGSLLMFAVERHFSYTDATAIPTQDLDHISTFQALGIGCFQCLALWPGFSRSASTIMGGMILGIQRKTAAEYSFIAAVPIIAGAAGYDLVRSFSLLTMDDALFFLVGSTAAFISALATIRFFINMLAKYTLRGFALYRLILAIPVYFFLSS